jgi:hypothetical protein
MHPVARHQVTPPTLVPAEAQLAFSQLNLSKVWDHFLLKEIKRSDSRNAGKDHFRLAALVHHRAGVRTDSARLNLDCVVPR